MLLIYVLIELCITGFHFSTFEHYKSIYPQNNFEPFMFLLIHCFLGIVIPSLSYSLSGFLYPNKYHSFKRNKNHLHLLMIILIIILIQTLTQTLNGFIIFRPGIEKLLCKRDYSFNDLSNIKWFLIIGVLNFIPTVTVNFFLFFSTIMLEPRLKMIRLTYWQEESEIK
ncbi:hypothetical protein [Candidatus Phytoplasma meliae]|uniref:Uncharacterized protein n=1 Tax=Candidatus Phytoplasma meliae TaxID=1848402 RepID=A0ABS5CYY9_9MOLU|nr:hypothetical protein [Candidatus Phytoplasma meliae]MBP5835805.1 hypothetical protein [Candidatus Phytoplasma meliae]MBP5836184.1 hypothetical protein [Candidatus Phytoplasma meliae]